MSTADPTTARKGAATITTTTTEAPSLLESAIAATKQTEPDRTESLLRNLTEQALDGTVKFDRNLTNSINKAIAAIDAKISEQLAAVMHDPKFLKLEGAWRGLNHLVFNTETSVNLKIRVLNVSKRELWKDLAKSVEFDQSHMFKAIYENEFGTPGGEPYGAMIGDYEFSNSFEDMELLQGVAGVSAAAFAPFISAASPHLFGFEDFRELARPRDLEKIFDTIESAKWRTFRESPDSRFVTLALPRVLARLPYGKETRTVDEFDYEESLADNHATGPQARAHEHYCWMNAAFVLGTRITEAFSKTNWATAIRGAESGGKVENLPLHIFESDDGDLDLTCPTEVGITDRRDAELGKLGFLPLCHYKNTDYAVFFGGQTAHKPEKYDRPEATSNAAISARLPYMMATSRFAHYLKVIGRDKIGSFMEAPDCEKWLNRWISNYVNAEDMAGPEMKARFPLREAKVKVEEVPGRPGSYNAVAWMRPWLQMEELTTSLRMVARIRRNPDAAMRAEPVLDADYQLTAAPSDLEIRTGPAGAPAYRRASAREQVDRLIMLIDQALTRQVNSILHHADFQALEARWRGLAYLVETSTDTANVHIKVLGVSWRELCRDLEKSVDFDQSHLFDLIYNNEFGMPGGEPYGLLIGDYRVGHGINADHGTDDVAALRTIAGVAAAAFAPFLLEARPELLQLDAFADLDRLPDMADVFDSAEFIRWQSLRALEDARFLGLLVPRVLMRLPLRPYDRRRIDGFMFEEKLTSSGRELLWGSPVYAFARIVVRAYGESGWFADLRGTPQDKELGGLVTDLPTLSFGTDRPGLAAQPPVEIRLTASQERALSDAGFIPLGCAPSTPYLVFNSNASLHRPLRTTSRASDENARIAAMLQYVLCASRFAHYLKVMMRDRIGSLGGAADIETMISRWLQRHCLGSDDASTSLKAQFPLRDASVVVREMPGRPGVLGCVLRLQPHFQLDDVSASFQLVAEVSTTAPV